MVTLRYAVTPVSAPRQTRADAWKKRPCVLRYREFCDAARAAGITVQDGDTITFVLPMPKSWKAKRRERSLFALHRQKPDLDNLCKALLDAVLPNDETLASIRLEKRWGAAGVSGEIVITRYLSLDDQAQG